jgi:translocation and assembly module TamB
VNVPAPATPANATPAPRKRFYRRKRFWKWSGGAIAALILIVLVLLYWLLQTVAGRDLLLGQVQARLPAGSTFTWERAQGPVAGPLTLYGVDFRFGDIHFTAERVYLDAKLRPLLDRRLLLDELQISNATLDLASTDEPFELPSWPDSLPQIEMPISLQADALEIDDFLIRQDGERLIDIERATGSLDIGPGYFKTERLGIDSDRGHFDISGGYEPRDGYRTDLVVTAVFPAERGRSPARIGLIARGDLSAMDVGIGGSAPKPLRIELEVRGAEDPEWSFSGATRGLDLALLGLAEEPFTPLAFDLEATGTNGNALLQGQVEQGDMVAVIEPSKLHVGDEVLTVDPLAIRVFDGRATLRGFADFSDPADPRFKFAVNARELQLGAAGADGVKQTADAEQAPAIIASADLGIAGRLQDWAAIGEARLTRAGETAVVDFDGRGDAGQMRLETLQATMPTGRLDVTGNVGWAPRLRWDLTAQLRGFDPGYFASGLDGNVSGQISSTGQARDQGGFQASVDVPDLDGTLRGQPLDGRGRFKIDGDRGEGALSLRLGESRVTAQGSVGDRLDIEADLQPLRLDDVLADAGGRLAGTLNISGPRNAPTLQADLSGSDLQWNDYTADSLSVRGRLPWRGSGGDLAVRGTGVTVGALIDTLSIDARGAVEDLELEAQAESPLGSLSLAGSALKRGDRWAGTLAALRLVPDKGAAWALRAPADFAVQGAAFTLEPACLAATGGGELCASADWPREGLVVEADSLPLALVQPWLPPREGRPLGLRGNLSLDASVRPAGNAWQGEIHLASLEGGLRLGSNAQRELISYDNFTFDAEFTPQRIEGRLGTGFAGDGYIDATFTTGWEEFAPLRGDLYFNNSNLFWLELFSPDLVRPDGVLAGHIGLAGTRAQPLLSGEATLTAFTGALPSLGITLVEGNATLEALSDGTASISGSVGSKSSSSSSNPERGRLQIEGSLGWRGEETPLRFNIGGSNFLAADTPDLRAVIAPEVQVTLADNVLAVRGQVTVPEATIDVEGFEGGVSASPDVVVLDPVNPQELETGSAVDLDLTVVVGEDVELSGYGLEGNLTGKIRVIAPPGEEMRAIGRLDVDGEYTAYGQDLQISRGELTWSNNIVSDPRINIRAEREVVSAGVTAGIDVTGRASLPRASIWSDPNLPESEALAYLVLGRPLNTASTDEARQVDVAQAALSAGAGLLASQLGARIGLDDAGVLESRTLGGSVFGVGKYLSPRLYVSYGVSIIGSGSALTLKYLLRKGIFAEIESSSVETRGSLNYRKEK